jgi:hypothetical protein
MRGFNAEGHIGGVREAVPWKESPGAIPSRGPVKGIHWRHFPWRGPLDAHV